MSKTAKMSLEELRSDLDKALDELKSRLSETVRIEMAQHLDTFAEKLAILEHRLESRRPEAGRSERSISQPSKSVVPDNLLDLPSPLTVRSLANYFEAMGFEVRNNRTEYGSGGLWVVEPMERFAHVVKHLKTGGVSAKYYANGRPRLQKPQYEIDPHKVLPA